MSMKFGKAELAIMEEVLVGEFDTVGEAAQAALLAAERVLQSRAKFVVVGQLAGTPEREKIPPTDPEAIKVSLGWYSTEGDALSAAESLWFSSASGDQYRTWVLPVHHGTPAELHAKAKAKYADQAEARKAKANEKLKLDIAKRHEAMEERNRAGVGSCDTCGHQPYDHRTDGSSRGRCGLDPCPCPKWREKPKPPRTPKQK